MFAFYWIIIWCNTYRGLNANTLTYVSLEKDEGQPLYIMWSHKYTCKVKSDIFINLGYFCPFCREKLHEAMTPDVITDEPYDWDTGRILYVCKLCGWWMIERSFQGSFENNQFDYLNSYGTRTHACASKLMDLDLTNLNIPLRELRNYLVTKYYKRYVLHPRIFEETVGSVFRDLGYDITITNYNKDGGIDVFLENDSGTIGVQVKRYKNSIKVGQIRELVGAKLLNDITHGIFVTTSDFQSGGPNLKSQFKERGYFIDLYDGKKFLSALKIAQLNTFRDYLKDLSWIDGVELDLLSFRHGCNSDTKYTWDFPKLTIKNETPCE